MIRISQATTRNALIRSLGAVHFGLLSPHLERVQLAEGDLLVSADSAIAWVHFPETAVVSIVDVLSDGARVEIGIVGFDGMAGWPVLLDCVTAMHDALVRIGGGTALRMPAETFAEVCRAEHAAASVFMRYIHAFGVQVGRTAVSNLRDPVERRLSRWLLMCHDRLEGDEIDCTHKVIAAMLGIRRASVTDGLHSLEGESAIRNRRGRIVIRDRRALRRLAGDGYGHSEAHYSQAIAPFGK